jgi:hypothetical protein
MRTLVAALVMASTLLATPASARDWKPCANEDTPGPCVWDARHMGNGSGKSFIRRKSGKVVYVTHRRAHRMLHG